MVLEQYFEWPQIADRLKAIEGHQSWYHIQLNIGLSTNSVVVLLRYRSIAHFWRRHLVSPHPTPLPLGISLMIPVDQISASLPAGNKDPRLLFVYLFIKTQKYMMRVHRRHRHREMPDRLIDWLIDWLSMVLRLRQHNIGYTADGFYRSDDPTNSVKALKEGG